MAFFNLWSSERLSFSLSIIAVISAAITAYHQFHSESSLSARFTNVEYSIDESSGTGTLRLQGVLMNSGTTQLTLVKQWCQLTIDTTRNNGNTLGKGAWFIKSNRADYVENEYPLVIKANPPISIEANSAAVFDSRFEFRQGLVSKLAGRQRLWTQSQTKSDNVTVSVSFYAEAVDPKTNVSARRMQPAFLFFEVSDTLIARIDRVVPIARLRRGSPLGFIEDVFRFPTFEPQDSVGLNEW